MNRISLSVEAVKSFVENSTIEALKHDAVNSLGNLINRSGKGNEFLGWLDLPLDIENQLDDISNTAEFLRHNAETIVVIGIGGSYLGAKSVIDALSPYFKKDDSPEIIYAGHHLSELYLAELLVHLKDKNFGIVVISKSGTTTEPAVAFRFLKALLEEKVGKEKARDLIIAITDKKKGALKQLATNEGYKSYVIPDDVGGRYSVLTPVGLLPIAIAGFDIKEIVKGAAEYRNYSLDTDNTDNDVITYAATRNALYAKGFGVEILANYEPRLTFIAEWWKQLYGESEGKEQKGIFPAAVNLTTDLHSMGQYIQDGQRILFETVLTVENAEGGLKLPMDDDNLDKLNYLAGKSIDYINKNAEEGTRQAHVAGGVPNLKLSIPEINEYYVGQLIYFFELACGVSGYMLDVNPFDQPGVEAYKSKMFELLGKPGI